MVPYKNIVFDMGRVLTDYDPDAATRQFTDDPAIIREVNLVVYHSGEWNMLDAGLISEEEALYDMKRHCSSDEVRRVAEQSFLHWDDYNLYLHPGMEEVVQAVHDAGKGVYMLSNNSVRMAKNDRWRDWTPCPDLFDGVLISACYHTLKPQHLIYETFCKEFGLKPEDCFFIDDLKRNIVGAKECGIDGMVFDGDAAALKKKLVG
ncbi:MAG: HAD family phosphatase [Eubacteriales bacterium]|jgi:putative hydrolase of the HAD superfamily